MATVGGTAMASTFEQVKMAEVSLKSGKDCVVLIIGNSGHYINSISRLLSSSEGLNDNHAVVETGPFELSGTMLDDGRAWVSKNSLRRLAGCPVKVAWVVGKTCNTDASIFVNTVFEKQDPSVVVIAIDNNSSKLESATECNRIIHVASFDIEMSQPHDCVSAIRSLPPSEITVRPSADLKAGKLEIWDSEKIILFGKTGSGKSTVAQMLTSGKVRVESNFKFGSDAKGVTKEVTRGQGRGWHVTDTPGFGETKEGSVPTSEATKRIANFIRETCGVYSHFVYVFKWSRLDAYDTRLWSFFQQVFNEAEDNFTVIVTNRGKDLSLKDKETLRKSFVGCNSFVCVDFPSVAKDPEIEEENEGVRTKSLEKLEKELASLGRPDKVCLEGKQSEARLAYTKGNVNAEVHCLGPVFDLATSVFHHLVMKPTIKMKGLTRASQIDENFMLLPQ